MFTLLLTISEDKSAILNMPHNNLALRIAGIQEADFSGRALKLNSANRVGQGFFADHQAAVILHHAGAFDGH